MQILDGTGRRIGAKVDDSNRLHTNALTIEEQSASAESGDSYNINTGDITLTSANESSVIYLKNNEDRDLVVPVIVYLLGTSTGGTGDTVIDVISGPTVGTTVSAANDVDVNQNKNFGSKKSLGVDAFKGAEAETLTDGVVAFSSRLPAGKFPYGIQTGDIVLPKGASMGVKVTPQASNTSMIIQIALAVHLRPAS